MRNTKGRLNGTVEDQNTLVIANVLGYRRSKRANNVYLGLPVQAVSKLIAPAISNDSNPWYVGRVSLFSPGGCWPGSEGVSNVKIPAADYCVLADLLCVRHLKSGLAYFVVDLSHGWTEVTRGISCKDLNTGLLSASPRSVATIRNRE